MSLIKKRPLYSVIETLKSELQSNPENVDKFLYSQRLANIGKLVCGISHSFNNILGGILGYSQLLKDELPENTNPHRHAAIIEKAAKRASKLISQLYLFSNIKHTYHKRPVDPGKIVEEVVSIIKTTFNPNIKISTSLAHQSQFILADFHLICQLIMNICLNAKEAMPEGGELSIQTRLAGHDEDQDLPGTDKKVKNILFEIKDTGTGIKNEHMPHIFKPYFSTKESSSGNGFGLSIAEGIVQDHKGRIQIHSEIGNGTTVRIYLPLTKAPSIHENTPEKDANIQGQGEVVLVVDDEEDIRLMTKKILERKGFKVLLADSGNNAIKVFEENAKVIRVVILDMILPGIDGLQVYRKLKKNGSKPKVILTSGYSQISHDQKFIDKLSTDCYLPKPWEIPQLIKEVNRLIVES